MSATGLTIRPQGELDFLSLGALVHRLDPGIIPFRKATECQIHVSGGEFNVAANLSDCFGLKTGIASAMADYPIGQLIAERVRVHANFGTFKAYLRNPRLTQHALPTQASLGSNRTISDRPVRLADASAAVLRLRRPSRMTAVVGLFDCTHEPHLDQMQHALVHDTPSYRFQ